MQKWPVQVADFLESIIKFVVVRVAISFFNNIDEADVQGALARPLCAAMSATRFHISANGKTVE